MTHHKFVLGARVRLRRDSHFWGQSNDSVGTILTVEDENEEDVWHNVDWDESDSSFCYPPSHLDLVSVMLGEEFSEQNKKKEVL